MNKITLLMLVTMVLAVSLAGGCNKFTRVRYETLHNGMTSDEVEAILGKPRVKFSDSWTYEHEDPYYSAKILFKNDRVVGMRWIDERVHEDDPELKPPQKDTPSESGKTIRKIN